MIEGILQASIKPQFRSSQLTLSNLALGDVEIVKWRSNRERYMKHARHRREGGSQYLQ